MDNLKSEGVVGFFDVPELLLNAAKKTKEAGFKDFDVFSPFPIHGMDDAQGLSPSVLPFITFGGGLTGAVCGFAHQYWAAAVDWPIIVGGKPFNSWPAFVPIMFECTVLFAGLATLAALLILNKLPNLSKKTIDESISSDRFAIVINEIEAKARAHLESLGAKDIRAVPVKGWFES